MTISVLSSRTRDRRHRVAVLVLDGALPLDVGIPAEAFHPETGFGYEVSACGQRHIGMRRTRVDTARELLESTRLSVDRIAEEVGLGTASNLRLHFRRLLDVSPTEYRAAFAGQS